MAHEQTLHSAADANRLKTAIYSCAFGLLILSFIALHVAVAYYPDVWQDAEPVTTLDNILGRDKKPDFHQSLALVQIAFVLFAAYQMRRAALQQDRE